MAGSTKPATRDGGETHHTTPAREAGKRDMTQPRNLAVLKVGGSVLRDDGSIAEVAGAIRARVDRGERLVVVVSALEGTTEQLIERARALNATPAPDAYAILLATGEMRSAALLALAAEREGIDARVLTVEQLGIEARGEPLSADPVGLVTSELEDAVASSALVIVPGFAAVGELDSAPNGQPAGARGAIRLLGRGGSDMTAVFLAAHLRARECVLIKDVDGWFVDDPRTVARARRYRGLSWCDAIHHPAPIVQDRAVELSERLGQSFRVAALASRAGTLVGDVETEVDGDLGESEPVADLPSRLDTRTSPNAITTASRLVHPPSVPGDSSGATSTPIYQTATFAVQAGGDSEGEECGQAGGWDYSRSGNPTRDVLERQLATLDCATRSFAYGSGMAAVNAALSFAPSGSSLVVGRDLYGGTMRLLETLARERGLEVRFVDTSSLDEIERVLEDDDASLVWLETPSNPRLVLSDITAISHLAHRAGALLAVDNSLLSPIVQRPLELGADLAVQSATKLLGGHSDLTAGVVSVCAPELAEHLAFRQNAQGTALSPFDSWLLLRGLATLQVRALRQIKNTETVSHLLRRHPLVERTYSVPGCSVVSFELGDVETARRFAEETTLFRTTVSFGGVASSVNLPCDMSHASVPVAWRNVQELSPALVRLSVGIEDVEDLEADIDRALARCRRARSEVA